MLTIGVGYSQNSTKTDTIYINDDSFEEQANYGARDSMFIDLKKNQIHLFGEAYLEYLETSMKAGYILVDLNKNEVFATYVLDKDSNQIEHPLFKNDGEEIQASRIRYNFNTQKGYIEEVKIKQDEIYLYMGVAKRQQNGDIHFKQGRFTTCELDEPHYHFQLSKAVLIPDKRIVTGPMNLWLKGVPTPFGLPFSIIPQAKDRTHGVLFPQIVPLSAYGFGVRDLGYYFPINESIHTNAFITLFNRGSWGVRNYTEYNKRYKRKGALDLSFLQYREGFPSNTNSNKFSITWNHQKDSKSNPFWNFSSNVNYISDNNTKNNLDPQNSQYFNNQLNSDINLNRSFPGKPISMGLKVSMRQNTLNKNIALTSPIFTTNVTRFFPFKKLTTKSNAISRIAVSYDFEGQNRSTFEDSLIKQKDLNGIQNQFLNGISQRMTLQTTAGFFGNTWKFNPSIIFSNRINFQQTTKTYDSIGQDIIETQHQKTGNSNELSFNASLTTVVYSYYRFVGAKKTLLRHMLTPSFTFSYIPKLNDLLTLDTGSVSTEIKQITYNPFENSLYTYNPTNSRALLSFSFNNTFELKTKSDKDTLTGFKKTRLVDAFLINGNYDFLKDTMNLSDIDFNLRISPFKAINFVASSRLSPYDWIDSTGKSTADYAINTRNKLGRLTSTNFTTTYVLTSKESREKLNDISKNNGMNWNADYAYFNLYPERILSFEIPWKFSFTHVYSVVVNTLKTKPTDRNFMQTQTLSANGDVSFTKRWKVAGTVNFDVQSAKVTYTTITLTRNMHCWNLMFNWIPIGQNQSFMFSLRSTASMFKDAKLDLRKPPVFF